ncbi:MAG: hypothetical protein JNJ73_01355 [Hyphomonadaceae bacterium]|nr:hypothetical protein [Hyphomonadaceae bacterium]
MRRTAGIFIAAMLACLAAACGETAVKYTPPAPVEEEELPDAIPPSDDDGVPQAPLSAPFNLPAYAPLRPGAAIEISQATAPSGEPGGLVTFSTDQAPRAVGDFYKGRLQREFGAVSDAANGPIRQLAAARGAERVDISIMPAEGGARVTIAYVLAPTSEAGGEH